MIRLMRLYEVETFVFLLHNFSIYYQVLRKVRFDKVFILLVGKFHLLNSICLCLLQLCRDTKKMNFSRWGQFFPVCIVASLMVPACAKCWYCLQQTAAEMMRIICLH